MCYIAAAGVASVVLTGWLTVCAGLQDVLLGVRWAGGAAAVSLLAVLLQVSFGPA